MISEELCYQKNYAIINLRSLYFDISGKFDEYCEQLASSALSSLSTLSTLKSQ